MQFPVSHPDDGLIDISIQEVVGVFPVHTLEWALTTMPTGWAKIFD